MKSNIVLALFCLCAIMIACAGGNKNDSSDPAYASASAEDGKKIFKQYCILCHGADGKLGLNGAKDLTVATLTFKERVALIKTGKNTMTPFEGILTDKQMKAAAKYTMTLTK